MTVQIGYRPDRIELLTHRTRATIDELASIRSTDPAALGALRAVRLLRRNLEDHWMPLLRRIESSRAMIEWRGSSLAGGGPEPVWLSYEEAPATSYSAWTDEQLVDELLQASSGVEHPAEADDRVAAIDPALTSEVARRVHDDPAFAAYLSGAADRLTVLGSMLPSGRFDGDVAAAIVRAMVTAGQTQFDTARTPFAADVANALDYLADAHPDRCLELFGDRDVLEVFVPAETNRSIPDDSVENFTTSALALAVSLDERLLDDSFRALASIIDVAGDRTVDVGVLRAAVNSLIVHLPALRSNVATGRADIHPDGSDVSLGSYDDVQRFYGQAMGDPEAQRVAGVILSGHLHRQLHALAPQLLDRDGPPDPGALASAIGATAWPVSRMVELLFVNGIVSESQRRNAMRGAEEAGLLTDLFLAPADALVGALSSAPGVKAAFDVGEVAVRRVVGGDEVDPVPDEGFRFTVPDQVRAATTEFIGTTDGGRAASGLTEISDDSWAIVTAVAATLATTSSLTERTELMRDLEEIEGADWARVHGFLNDVVSHSDAPANARSSVSEH